MSSEFISDTIGVGSGKTLPGAIGCSRSLSVGSSSPYCRSDPNVNKASIAILVSSFIAATNIFAFCSSCVTVDVPLLALALIATSLDSRVFSTFLFHSLNVVVVTGMVG